MSGFRDYPIIFGGGLQKGLFITQNKRMGGIDLSVVWLTHDVPSGEPFDIADIDGVDAVLHFSNRKQVERLIGILTVMLDKNWGGRMMSNCCGRCKYCRRINGEWVCDNEDSIGYAEPVLYTDTCEDFDGRESPWKNLRDGE